jgi:hypothetical protein
MTITITRTTDVDDDGTYQIGTIHDNAYKVALYDQIDEALAQVDQTGFPAWTTVPFNSADFTCSVSEATWFVGTTDIATFAWTKKDDTMIVALLIEGSDLLLATTAFYVQIPGSYLPTKKMRTVMMYNDAGTGWADGFIQVNPGVGALMFYKYSGAWTTTASHNTQLSATMRFEVD